MKSWQEDLLCISEAPRSEQEVFSKVETAARVLGFEHCAYGARMPLPLSNPRIFLINNYPEEWRCRYLSEDYIRIDPTIACARASSKPVVWSDEIFQCTPEFWEEAFSFGLHVGWAKSSLSVGGIGGMLTLSRANEQLDSKELDEKEVQMCWLVNIAHFSFSHLLDARILNQYVPDLTGREVEVLKWTADGKTANEISDLLSLSKNTIDFHIKNAVAKLQTANKTAAVVRAAMLGLLT